MEKNYEISNDLIKKIAIIGTESTGKTTLSEQLAKHYETIFVGEYAREYVSRLEKKYTLQDIEAISRKQVALEDEKVDHANKFLFCDTNLIVSKIWAENAFGKCPEWIIGEIENRHYDLHVLTDIDLPWVEDGLREHPHLRKELMERYKAELELRKLKYKLVSGVGAKRLENAIDAINKFFKDH